MEDGYQRGQRTYSSLASTQPTSPREDLVDDDEPQVKEKEVPLMGRLRLKEGEIPLMSTRTDPLQLLEDVVSVRPACIHAIRDLRVWRWNLATSAVNLRELVEEPVLAHRVYVTADIFGAATNVPLDNDDEYNDTEQRDWIMAETEHGVLTQRQKDEVSCC